MTNILVTGGAGFIGSNFVRYMVNKYQKAEVEYRKYQVKTLSSVAKAYIETLKELKRIEGKKK